MSSDRSDLNHNEGRKKSLAVALPVIVEPGQLATESTSNIDNEEQLDEETHSLTDIDDRERLNADGEASSKTSNDLIATSSTPLICSRNDLRRRSECEIIVWDNDKKPCVHNQHHRHLNCHHLHHHHIRINCSHSNLNLIHQNGKGSICSDTMSGHTGDSHDDHPCHDHCGTEVTHSLQRPRCSSMSSLKYRVQSEDGQDHTDAMPKHMRFTWLDIIAILFSIGSFMFDIGTDIAVATIHYFNEKYSYFGLTIVFIAFPTIVMTGISLRWYILDAREESSTPVSPLRWTMRVTFLLLQLGPILRYFDSLQYGLKFRQNKNEMEQKRYFQYMVYEDTDATMLRLFECFMEAAPQLVLQIYILAKEYPHDPNDYWTVVTQVVAVVASLVSLSWSLVSYHKSLRMSLPDKRNMTWQGTAVQFLWRLFVIAARVLALALFASIFTVYISIVCGIHWLLMLCWIISMKTRFSHNKLEELGYNAVLAVMFIFCYFNPVDSPTRYRYTTYYVFTFFENTMLMTMWFVNSDANLWYRIPAMAGHYLSYVTGLIFMVVYYLLLHPTGEIKVFRDSQKDRSKNSNQSRRPGYVREVSTGLWTTQGRVLHPRPTVPTTIVSRTSPMKVGRRLSKSEYRRQVEKDKGNNLTTNSTIASVV